MNVNIDYWHLQSGQQLSDFFFLFLAPLQQQKRHHIETKTTQYLLPLYLIRRLAPFEGVMIY